MRKLQIKGAKECQNYVKLPVLSTQKTLVNRICFYVLNKSLAFSMTLHTLHTWQQYIHKCKIDFTARIVNISKFDMKSQVKVVQFTKQRNICKAYKRAVQFSIVDRYKK